MAGRRSGMSARERPDLIRASEKNDGRYQHSRAQFFEKLHIWVSPSFRGLTVRLRCLVAKEGGPVHDCDHKKACLDVIRPRETFSRNTMPPAELAGIGAAEG